MFLPFYPKYRNANTCIVTNEAETGHLYQLSSLIRICTICNLANNIVRTTIDIIMFRLKKKIKGNNFLGSCSCGFSAYKLVRCALRASRGRTHGAGCVRQWFRTAEPLGERRYENWNTHTHMHASKMTNTEKSDTIN